MKRGFTLIELLVVIAIIGMLSSVVLASLNTARESARDAKRKQDLKQIQVAMELYYNDNNVFPGETWCDSSKGSAGTSCSSVNGTDWTASSAIYSALVPNYISKLPVDPTNLGNFYYNYEPANPAGQNYCLGAALEGGGRFQIQQGTPAGSC
ncbi:type II secretion system protein [Candidatus Wolfebacteria bacterium]|nr:type II secretion system protein [Candidatus Wolfebacteria bacterium]